jgi:hypothetical protein
LTYTKVDGRPCRNGETVVQLDSGEYVAVRCDREHSGGCMVFRAYARVIDEAGQTLSNTIGKAMESSVAYTVQIPIVESEGADVIARDCLLAVLGEPVGRWDAQWLASASIRSHLIAAPSVGTVDAGSLL